MKPRGFEFEFEDVPVIINAFRRMVRRLDFDVSEMAITTYICARAHGKRFTALPIFPMRAFHHGAIVCNANAGIQSPKDLEGKKVGVNRGYTVTTGLWARSILQDEYGVDLSRITWVLSGDEHVAEYHPPSNVVPVEQGQKLEDLVLSGEVPAAIGVQIDSPLVVPLIPHAKEAGFRALRERGLYPINHTVVVKDELLAAHPDLAAEPLRRIRRREASLSGTSGVRLDREPVQGRWRVSKGDGDDRRSTALRRRAQSRRARGGDSPRRHARDHFATGGSGSPVSAEHSEPHSLREPRPVARPACMRVGFLLRHGSAAARHPP